MSPTQDATPILDCVLNNLENMAVDIEAATNVLDDPDSSESARSLAMSTLTLVPHALRFFIEFFANCTPPTEDSPSE